MVDKKKDGQISFGDMGMELVTNLDTGEQTLRPTRAKKAVGGQVRTPAPTRQWWERMGFMAFNKAAEGWRQSEAASIAETFGYNVESAGAQMNRAETEELLKKAFRVAQRSRIPSLEVVEMMKAESLSIEERLGTGANWLPAFVDSAIDLVAEVYRLKSASKEARKIVAHQRRLPAFH